MEEERKDRGVLEWMGRGGMMSLSPSLAEDKRSREEEKRGERQK